VIILEFVVVSLIEFSGSESLTPSAPPRYSDLIVEGRERLHSGRIVIGVLKGEGIGPDVVHCALDVLSAIHSLALEARGSVLVEGGAIGNRAFDCCGEALSAEVRQFCEDMFARHGAILCGPGGGRFVYELRRAFDLFCKLAPIRPQPELYNVCPLKPEFLRDVDILVIRENLEGVYQGRWTTRSCRQRGRIEEHTFHYSEQEVQSILAAACRIARRRSGRVAVVIKDGGVPGISGLWRECAGVIGPDHQIECSFIDVDLAAYKLIRHPQELDVLVTPNLFGDILVDLGGVLAGSRGLTYSGNFAADGSAVYQTNHGAAFDLAGTDRANPIGQIYALEMLLRESFGLTYEAGLIGAAVAEVLRHGWRTFDIMEPGCRLVGTRRMGSLIAEAVYKLGSRTRGGESAVA
jgi:3-isopropylmalate dehydrogenase